jgi:hypothetical protein
MGMGVDDPMIPGKHDPRQIGSGAPTPDPRQIGDGDGPGWDRGFRVRALLKLGFSLKLESVLESASFDHQLGAICGALGRLSSQSVSWHAGSILCHIVCT